MHGSASARRLLGTLEGRDTAKELTRRGWRQNLELATASVQERFAFHLTVSLHPVAREILELTRTGA